MKFRYRWGYWAAIAGSITPVSILHRDLVLIMSAAWFGWTFTMINKKKRDLILMQGVIISAFTALGLAISSKWAVFP